jgi:phosphatidylserine decarboxylase precursor
MKKLHRDFSLRESAMHVNVAASRLVALASVLLLLAPSAWSQAADPRGGPATVELRRLVASDPEIRHLLLKSIEQAKQINPDPVTNPAQTLDQYFAFVARSERALPSNLVEPKPGSTMYQRIDQSLAYQYFIYDQPLEELKGRGYFKNTLENVPAFAAWLRSFEQSWAKYLNSPDSWSAETLHLAQADPVFGLDRGWYEDASKWTTFNEFFARRLKSADQRPVASRDDPSILASPVDAIPEGTWAIDAQSRIAAPSGIAIKTGTVMSVADLIGVQSRYRHAFAGGTFMHLFLDVGDYHRYHFPLDGVVRELTILPGPELTGGSITWDQANKRYAFDPSSIGWQSLERRGLVILETDKFGLVALLAIGMSPVSSVNYAPTLKLGARVKKGDELGYFLFGGSDFVIVFQSGITFAPDSPRDSSNKGFSHVLMGERLGQLRRIAAPSR